MDTPNWRQIIGGTAGVALLGAVGYFGQARIRTDSSPQKFVSGTTKGTKKEVSPKSSTSSNNAPKAETQAGDFDPPVTAKRIKVDITGEVTKPGVYELSEGQRVEDLIKLAGGLKKSADQDHVNQAQKLKDEQKVVVPAKGALNPTKRAPKASSFSPPQALAGDLPVSDFRKAEPKSSKKSPPSSPVSLSTATEEDLQTIPGIGPSMAKKIIDYRTELGGFGQIEDLKNIKGMGEKLFEKVREWITL